MHTPEQAGALWCPMVRAVRWECDDQHLPNGTPGNLRAVGGCNSGGAAARSPQGARCLADKCAMWRWVPGSGGTESGTTEVSAKGGRGFYRPPSVTVVTLTPLPPTHGICGLAPMLTVAA